MMIARACHSKSACSARHIVHHTALAERLSNIPLPAHDSQVDRNFLGHLGDLGINLGFPSSAQGGGRYVVEENIGQSPSPLDPLSRLFTLRGLHIQTSKHEF